MKPAAFRVRQTAEWLARSSISSALALLCIGVAIGLVGTLWYAREFELLRSYGAAGSVSAAAIATLAIIVFACAVYLAKRRTPFLPWIYIVGLLIGGLALHLLLIATVEPHWGVDYLRYWQYAQRMVERGEYNGLRGPYYARALFVPYPVVRIFGPDAIFALKLTNVLLLGGIQVAIYDMLRRVRGHQAAQAGSLLFLAAPFPAYSTMIPSHDLWGLFFLAITAWTVICATISAREKRYSYAWLALAVLSGLLAYLTEVQRNIGLFFCLALLIAAALVFVSGITRDKPIARSQSLRWLFVALICLGTYFIAGVVDNKTQLNYADRPALTSLKIAANGGGMGNGKSDWFARFDNRFGEKRSTPEEAADFAVSSTLSSWSLQPAKRAVRLARHSARLFSLTYPRDWDWTLRSPEGISERTRESLVFYCDAYGLLFGSFLLVGLLDIATRKKPASTAVTALLVFLVVLALPLLLVFENKPYNIFPIWMIGAISIGYVLPSLRWPGTRTIMSRLSPSSPAVGGLALLAFASALVLFTIQTTYTVARGRLLSDWSLEADQSNPAGDPQWRNALLEARPEAFDPGAYNRKTLQKFHIARSHDDGERIQRYAGDAVTRIQFPAPPRRGDKLILSTLACTSDSGRRNLEFFAYSPKGKRHKKEEFVMDVMVDARDLLTIEIPFSGKKFQRFAIERALSDNSCHTVAFRLRAIAPRAAADDHGPFVEVWMPRLIH